MCEECKGTTKPEVTAETLAELKIASTPSSDSDVIMFFDPLDIGTDNLAEDINIQLDRDEFIKGLKDVSRVCGMYTGLLNAGWSLEDSVAYIFNKMNVDHNIEVAKINANSNVEVSKNASMIKDKESL